MDVMDVYEKDKVMLSVLSLMQKKIDEAYALGEKEAQAEIDVWKQRALNAEGLLKKIRTVHVTKTKGWFEDIDYLFKQEGFEWKNGYYEKTKHRGE